MFNLSARQRVFAWITLFSIAMGFMESAVVVYLRAQYYPLGFKFPISPLDSTITLTELIREASTIVMLISIGVIAGKTRLQRFAWFIYCFAVWDIFYYIFLKLLIGWPESVLTWDILFLIPVVWTGPVLAPVVLSITMIALAVIILIIDLKGLKVKLGSVPWLLLIFGSMLIVLSFVWDFSSYILNHYRLTKVTLSLCHRAMNVALSSYIPNKFNWFLFIFGELIILWGIVRIAIRSKIFTI